MNRLKGELRPKPFRERCGCLADVKDPDFLQQFDDRRQQPEEPVLDYIAAMMAAATGIDMSDHYLRAFIIKGMKVVKQQNPQTVDGLQKVAKQAELAEVETEDKPTAAITALMAEVKSLRSEQAEVKALMAERSKSADQPVAATSVPPQQSQQPAQWQFQQPGMSVPWLPQQPAWQPPPYANFQSTPYPTSWTTATATPCPVWPPSQLQPIAPQQQQQQQQQQPLQQQTEQQPQQQYRPCFSLWEYISRKHEMQCTEYAVPNM